MIEAYETLVRRLAETSHPEIISNSAPDHAAFLVGEMFRHGSGQARIFSNLLPPALYASENAMVCLGCFLADKKSTLRILLKEETGRSNARFFIQQVKKRLGESALSRIEVKEADEFAKVQTYNFVTVGE
jgi:hypothetical protein